MRASWLMAILFFLSAPVVARDFFVEDETLTALPEFVEGVVRAHWSFKGYERCQVVGKAINLAESGETEGYAATTADDCEWMGDSGPIWIVERLDGALQMVASDIGLSLTARAQSRNGMRNFVVSALVAGSLFESLWEFNGTRYHKMKDRREVVSKDLEQAR